MRDFWLRYLDMGRGMLLSSSAIPEKGTASGCVVIVVWGSRWHGVESRHPTIAVPLLSKKTIGEQVLSDVFWGMGGREFTHGSSGPPVAVQ